MRASSSIRPRSGASTWSSRPPVVRRSRTTTSRRDSTCRPTYCPDRAPCSSGRRSYRPAEIPRSSSARRRCRCRPARTCRCFPSPCTSLEPRTSTRSWDLRDSRRSRSRSRRRHPKGHRNAPTYPTTRRWSDRRHRRRRGSRCTERRLRHRRRGPPRRASSRLRLLRRRTRRRTRWRTRRRTRRPRSVAATSHRREPESRGRRSVRPRRANPKQRYFAWVRPQS